MHELTGHRLVLRDLRRKPADERLRTAFQVDRARYDEILLDRAAELGCEVRYGAHVRRIERTKDRIDALELEGGETVTATHYVDASGAVGLLRRAMGVEIDAPSTLRNIAIWDYWQNADWAVEIGVGGTRIQIMSLGWGWMWFIPMGPTRTSIGLVVPAGYYKETGLRPADLYARAVAEEPRIAGLLKNATSEGKLESTKDWSILAKRHTGANWYLVGESAGFADPILSAGVTMAQVSARELAYTIAEIERGEHKAKWLKEQFEIGQRERILTHIRFGDYWYTANSQFTDLQAFTAELARDAGLDLTPEKAWAWLAQGGFITHDLRIGVGGFDIRGTLKLGEFLSDLGDVELQIERNNLFKLDFKGATWTETAVYHEGRVHKETCYVRGERRLPVYSQVGLLIDLLQQESRYPVLMERLREMARQDSFVAQVVPIAGETLEAMISDGWIKASYDPRLPLLKRSRESRVVRPNTDSVPAGSA